MPKLRQKPLLAITLGDPAGIGPEVVARALAGGEVARWCRPLVVGSAGVLERALALVGARLPIHTVSGPQEVGEEGRALQVLDPAGLEPAFAPGQVSAGAGRASMEWALLAGRLAVEGRVDGVVNAPINKEAVRLAGYTAKGHMEAYQRLTGAPAVATMLVAGPLRVAHLTTHLSLRQACNAVTLEAVLEKVRLLHSHLRRWGFARPRIAVSALNPHASDGGLLGSEEAEHIAPAVARAREEGIDARGPLPADTVFHQAIQGMYDAVLAMYHDQGHIPIKVYGFERSVSVALGLPFVRTSVDHGTAFDIAWKGVAQHLSMLEALRTAAWLAGKGRLPPA